MMGNPKVVKDPFYAEKRINLGVAQAEPGIAVFGINPIYSTKPDSYWKSSRIYGHTEGDLHADHVRIT